MTPDQRKECAQICLKLMQNSGIKLKSKAGETAAMAFWAGVLAYQAVKKEEPDACIAMHLMSGRVSELMKEGDK